MFEEEFQMCFKDFSRKFKGISKKRSAEIVSGESQRRWKFYVCLKKVSMKFYFAILLLYGLLERKEAFFFIKRDSFNHILNCQTPNSTIVEAVFRLRCLGGSKEN